MSVIVHVVFPPSVATSTNAPDGGQLSLPLLPVLSLHCNNRSAIYERNERTEGMEGTEGTEGERKRTEL